MEYVDLINRILSAEHSASAIAQEVKDRQAGLDRDLARESEELRQRAQTIEFLGLIGTVVPLVKQNVAIKRYTTLYQLEPKQLAAVAPAFDLIIEELGIKK